MILNSSTCHECSNGRSSRNWLLAALVAFCIGITGCDDTVNPIIESDRQITLFATLDMDSDVQYVRFIPIRETIVATSIDPSKYSLVSTDLTNGAVVTWSDSLITFDNGAVGLIFYANTRVQPGHTYSFEATMEGSSIVTSAVTTVPPLPGIQVEREVVDRFVGGTGFIVVGSQEIKWSGIGSEPYRVELWYRFLRQPNEQFRDIRVDPLPDFNYQNGEIELSLNLTSDRFFLADSVDLAKNALMGIGMEITNLDDQFVPPGGVFDPEVLVQPGTFSNVTNGFGYIGSVGRFRREWTLSDESMRLLKYQTPGDLFGKADLPK